MYYYVQLLSRVWLSVTPCAVAPPRLFCPWGFLVKSTGVGCHFLLQRIFQTQGLNSCLLWFLHWHGGFFTTDIPGKPTYLFENMPVSCCCLVLRFSNTRKLCSRTWGKGTSALCASSLKLKLFIFFPKNTLLWANCKQREVSIYFPC